MQSPHRKFFEQHTITVAQRLLGCKLTTNIGGKSTSGMIVEVEAYRDQGDEACHTAKGKTKRNEVMFNAGGFVYVYFIYGMYHCANIVTEPLGRGCAVLLRAIEPIDGIETMLKRRKIFSDAKTKSLHTKLANGPSKLCLALGINNNLSGHDILTSQQISLSHFQKISKSQILSGPRIGISKATDLNWRFWIKNNKWVSKQ
jgi:DNA-3-methyladenine glycosylase